MQTIDLGKLIDASLDMVVSKLEERGNVLSPMHRVAMLELVSAFSLYAVGEMTGRNAYGHSTGLGKTTAVAQWIAACHLLGYSVPVAVAAARVESLCCLKRDLIEAGVPATMIGLLHAYHYDAAVVERCRLAGAPLPEGFASEPSTGKERSYPIQLVSHSRIRGRKRDGTPTDFELYARHEGEPRRLLIYDEALLRGTGRSVNHRAVRIAVAALSESDHINVPIVRQAYDFLVECRDEAQRAVDSLNARKGDDSGEGIVIKYPEKRPEEIRGYRSALPQDIGGDGWETLDSLLDICQDTLRVLVTGEGAGILWATVVVPADLTNVCILDASDPIRELIRLDKTIRSASSFAAPGSVQLKTFERVSVTQLVAGGGRATMTKRVAADERKACRDFVEIIEREWTTSRGILIFSVKARPKGLDMAKALKSQLRAAGIDIDATVSEEDRRPKLIWKTFGATEGENGMEYADVVLCAGTMYRSQHDLASAAQAMADNVALPTPPDLISRLIESEAASLLFQAASRGSCRRIQNGSAVAMKLYFVHRSKSIKTLMDRVMPDARWTFQEKTNLRNPKPEGLVDQMATLILDHLSRLDPEVQKVSSSAIKRALSLAPEDEASKSVFRRAARLISDRVGSGWCVEGRGFSREFAKYFETALN